MASAQQYLRNGAMEGAVTGNNNPPDYWGVCDIFSTPELRTEFFRNSDTVVSPDRSMFSVLRVRGLENEPAGTTEHLFTKLITPLEKEYCYQFSAWLYQSYNASWSLITEPVKLQLWGGLDSCSMDEMLYESELIITDASWKEYMFNFVVENYDYPYFYIRPYWDFENISEYYYEGVIMMDNLAIQQIKPIVTVLADTIYYSADRPIQLESGEGLSYSWDPSEVVSDANIPDPLLLEYTDTLVVTVEDEDHCPIREPHMVLIECDSVYKNEILNQYDIYYSLEHDVELTASTGYSYNWEPQINLTGYDIQNPILTDYQESFRVVVEDEFGCFFNEQFNIIADCDTLYPIKSFYTLDTVIYQGEELILQPTYGDPSVGWLPVAGLSCVECRTPEAYPSSSTLYSVELSDRFNCLHEELFAIEVILEVPNVITPNNDGYNDEFIVKGLPPGSSMQIYTKEGTLIYSNTNYGHPEWWNGIDSNGNFIAAGSYWYALEIPSMNYTKKDFIFVKR